MLLRCNILDLWKGLQTPAIDYRHFSPAPKLCVSLQTRFCIGLSLRIGPDTPPKTVLYTASAVGFCKRSHSRVSHLNGWAFGSSGVWDELGLAPCTVSGVSEFGGLLVFEFWRYFSLWYSICSGKGELGLLCFLLILVWLGWFDCRAGAAKVPRASGERSLRCLVGLERWRWWPMFLVWCGVLRWKSCDFVSDCLIWIAVGCLWFLCFLDFF